MKGNFQVRFLGGPGRATAQAYPVATPARTGISSPALNPKSDGCFYRRHQLTEAQHIALLALPDRGRLQGESLKQIFRHANPSLRVGEGGGTGSRWICEVKFV